MTKRKRIPDDLDRRRGQPPRNGEHLSNVTRVYMAQLVGQLWSRMHQMAEDLDRLRHDRGDRTWRCENLTATQRRALKKAVGTVRKAARKWLK